MDVGGLFIMVAVCFVLSEVFPFKGKNPDEKIQQVFKAKNVKVDELMPVLLRRD